MASPSLVSKPSGVGRQRPVQGPFRTREEIALANARAYKNYRSLHCDGEYDAVRMNERLQAKISKMTWTSPDPFCWRRVAEKPVLVTAMADSEHQHRAVEFREDYTEVPQIGNRPPFYLGMPAGKMFMSTRTRNGTQRYRVESRPWRRWRGTCSLWGCLRAWPKG